MRAVVQRVLSSAVTIDGVVHSQIECGFLILVGVEQEDTDNDALALADKILGLRVFNDADQKMNLSIDQVGGAMLVVSQFTLLGDCRKGRRPSFIAAAPPDRGNELYLRVVERLKESGLQVETGKFQADMKVSLVNDGPVTLLIDTKKLF